MHEVLPMDILPSKICFEYCPRVNSTKWLQKEKKKEKETVLLLIFGRVKWLYSCYIPAAAERLHTQYTEGEGENRSHFWPL